MDDDDDSNRRDTPRQDDDEERSKRRRPIRTSNDPKKLTIKTLAQIRAERVAETTTSVTSSDPSNSKITVSSLTLLNHSHSRAGCCTGPKASKTLLKYGLELI